MKILCIGGPLDGQYIENGKKPNGQQFVVYHGERYDILKYYDEYFGRHSSIDSRDMFERLADSYNRLYKFARDKQKKAKDGV